MCDSDPVGQRAFEATQGFHWLLCYSSCQLVEVIRDTLMRMNLSLANAEASAMMTLLS